LGGRGISAIKFANICIFSGTVRVRIVHKGQMVMRKYWIVTLPVFGLVLAASLVSRFPANAVTVDEFHQPSIMMAAPRLPEQYRDPLRANPADVRQSAIQERTQ
jgi:hypothetical protein